MYTKSSYIYIYNTPQKTVLFYNLLVAVIYHQTLIQQYSTYLKILTKKQQHTFRFFDILYIDIIYINIYLFYIFACVSVRVCLCVRIAMRTYATAS